MRSRRAKRRKDGRCAHAHIRPVWATTEAEPHRGTSIVICVHCAAFWVAGRVGWTDSGTLKQNIAARPLRGFREGSVMRLLSYGVTGDFGAAASIAERAADIGKESTCVP